MKSAKKPLRKKIYKMLDQSCWDQVGHYYKNQSPRFPSRLLHACQHHLIIYTYLLHNTGTSYLSVPHLNFIIIPKMPNTVLYIKQVFTKCCVNCFMRASWSQDQCDQAKTIRGQEKLRIQVPQILETSSKYLESAKLMKESKV